MSSVHGKTPYGVDPFILGSTIEFPRTFPESVTPQALPGILPPYIKANWKSEILFRTEFFTDVEETYELSEERIGFSERPRRSIEVTFTGLSIRQSEKLLHYIHRKSNEKLPFLIYCDQADLEEPVSSGSTEIPLFTYYRRFFPGQRIFIVDENSGLSEFSLIDTLYPSKIVLQNPLSNSYAASTKIFPVFDSDLIFDFPISLITDSHVEIPIACNEFFSSSLLPIEYSQDASFLPFFSGLPVYDPSISWDPLPSVSFTKPGEIVTFKNASYSLKRSNSLKRLFQLSFLSFSRKEVWNVLRLFENRRGQALPFWILNPQSLFSPTSITSTYIEVEKDTDFSLLEDPVPYIGLDMTTGIPVLKKVLSITDQGSVNRISFDSPLSSVPALSSIKRCTTAHTVRFSQDVLEERWITNTACNIETSFLEVLNPSVLSLS